MRTKLTHVIGAMAVTASTALVAFSGCDRDQRAAAATRLDPAMARAQIAEARCALEERCGKVGADRDYADRNACLSRVQADWRDELNFSECRGGIDRGELAECMREIRASECGSALDTMSRIAACRSSDLCKRF